MTKKWLPITEGVAIVALIIGLFAKGNTNQTQIAQKESEISVIQTQLDEKDAKLSELDAVSEELEALQSKYATLESEKTELSDKLSAFEEKETDSEKIESTEKEEMSEAATENVSENETETAAETASKNETETAVETASENETEIISEAVTVIAEDKPNSAGESAKESEKPDVEVAKVNEEAEAELAKKDSELAEKNSELEEKNTQLAEKEQLLAEKDSELEQKNQEFEAKEAQYQQQAEDLQKQLEKIMNVRGEMIQELKDSFADTDLAIDIDEETGIVALDTNVLFGFDNSDLTKEGMALLEEFVPKYMDVVFSDKVKDYVSEVIIEGHTDDTGTYLYNMYMSQKRAYSVAKYCLDKENDLLSEEEAKELGEVLTVNGRSYSDPILDKEGKIDDAASRRVEVKFRLISDDLLNAVQE